MQDKKTALNLPAIGMLVLAIVIAIIPVLPLPDFWIIQANYAGLYALPVLGLVMLTGVCGLTSFGQAAFVGIGAYTTAYLTTAAGLSPWVTLFIGIGFTAISALLIGLLTLRMSGHYLPLATIAWALSLYYLMGNVSALGKYDGILGIQSLSVLGFDLGQKRGFFVLTWAIVLLCALVVLRLLDSRAGRAIRALKTGSQLAEAMGVNTLKYKIGVFVFAAILASISGWLFAHFQRTVNPSPFGLKWGIEYLFMAVIGGVGHVWGALVGSALTKLLEDQLQVWLPALIGTSGSYETIVFGIIIVVMLKYLPDGLWSFVGRRVPQRNRVVDWKDATPLPVRPKPGALEKVLEVKSARKVFGGLVAVNDISFQTSSGQIVGLIGPNGAGKSTTFNLVTGLLKLSGGEIIFRGQAISGLPSRDIAALGISRTFQHVKMIADMTVLENVALGAHLRGKKGPLAAMLHTDRVEEKRLLLEAQRQLERIGMGDYLHELAGNLAMGQQRLLEIARALCGDPLLLLLDEPAAGLRHKEKEALGKVLTQLRDEGMSILLVEHDMGLVMGICDHLVVMEFGTYLMAGTPAEVQRSPAVRAAYLGTEH